VTAPKIRPISPDRYFKAIRRTILDFGRSGAPVPEGTTSRNTYADLYEQHAASLPPDSSIGDGDFDLIGQRELAILTDAGLTPTSTLLDFGCGTGRLAVHAVPFLSGGRYIGTDIAPTMLVHAASTLEAHLGTMPDNATFEVQLDETFPAGTVPDMICAFSVFTHMEHEDIFRYLRSALSVSMTHTTFVASCLQLDLPEAQNVFSVSASKSLDERWREVRNVVTSPDLFTEVARLAGWAVTAWYPANGPAGTMPDGERVGIGQSVVVMNLVR
jgi:SAM-dependent methyltransferase